MKKTVLFTMFFLALVWLGTPSGEFATGQMVAFAETADDPIYVKGPEFIVSSVKRREGWPRVAYGSDGTFLVVWIKFGKGGNQNVLGQLIARDGTFIGSQIPIAKEREEVEGFPHLAYSSASRAFLVVWRNIDQAGNHDIYGRLVADDGSLLGSRFPISSGPSEEKRPWVAHDPDADRFLVVWYDLRGGDEDVYGQLVDADGSLYGDEIPIATEVEDQHRPGVAFGVQGGRYLVTWADFRKQSLENTSHSYGINHAPRPWDIYGQLIDSRGNTIGGNFFIFSSTLDQELRTNLSYDPNLGRFFLVWNNRVSDNNYETFGQLIDEDGNSIGDPINITTNKYKQRRPSQAYNPYLQQYFVAFGFRRKDGDEPARKDLYARVVGSLGELIGGRFAITKADEKQQKVEVAASDTGEVLAVWMDERNPDTKSDIYGRIFYPKD